MSPEQDAPGGSEAGKVGWATVYGALDFHVGAPHRVVGSQVRLSISNIVGPSGGTPRLHAPPPPGKGFVDLFILRCG